MARKNDKADVAPKPKPKQAAKRKATSKPGGKRPTTPADEEETVVSLSRLRANPRRGGRGR